MKYYRELFAVCVIKNRYVLLSGGFDLHSNTCSDVYVFDTQIEEWISEPQQPNLKNARAEHSSCATEESVLVYGGWNKDNEPLNSIEFMSLLSHHNFWGNEVAPHWISVDLRHISARIDPLMAVFSSSIIIIFGGFDGEQYHSDGVLFDSSTKKETQHLNAGDIKFRCERNRYCITEYGALIAAVANSSGSKLIEVSTTDYKVTALQDQI